MHQDSINEIFSEELTEEEYIDIEIKFSLGRLIINPFSSTKLYQMEATYPNENYTPKIDFYKGKRAKLILESQKISSSISSTFSIDKVLDLFSREKRNDTISSNSNRWDLKLSKNIPMSMNVKGGASEQQLELGGLKISDFKISTGASLTSINFSEPNEEKLNMKIDAGAASFEAKGLGNANLDVLKFDGGVGKSMLNFSGELRNTALIEISGGLGLIELGIPKNTGAIIRAKSGKLLSVNNIPSTFAQKGDMYINSAYDENKPYLNINIDLALGSLSIFDA